MYRVFALLIVLPVSALASPWYFQEPITVGVFGTGIYHHLGTGGRSGIAVSGRRVAIVWEDNRTGNPACYLALIDPQTGKVAAEHRVSGTGDAYEPSVTGIGDGRFAVAWEQDGHVWLRLPGPHGVGKAIRLDADAGTQASLARRPDGGLVAVWSGEGQRIWLADIALPAGPHAAPRILRRAPIEAGQLHGSQNYPSAVVTPSGQRVIAWEDRRQGHTAIFFSAGDAAAGYSPAVQINESFWGGRRLGYGRGTGAMRVMLANAGDAVVAVWADKRNFRSGYDVYAAFGSPDGAFFGSNQKVQDAFADHAAQWHPGVASGAGLVVVAWDDDRDGTHDVWLSWLRGADWSDDLDVPGASGPGDQSEPAVALDRHGNLHIAWLHNNRADGTGSRLRYLYAPRKD